MTPEREGWATSALRLALGLPPAFLAVLLLNLVLLGGMFVVFQRQQADRTDLIKKMFDTCLASKPLLP